MVVDRVKYRDLFVDEARRRLAEAATALEALDTRREDDPGARVGDVFRNVHTLKGMSATMEYHGLTLLSHALEDLCDALRKGNLAPGDATFARLGEGLERLGTMIDAVAAGDDPEAAPDLEEAIRGHLRHEGVTGFNLIEPATEPIVLEAPTPAPRDDEALGALTELMAVAQHLRALNGPKTPLTGDIARLERATRRIFGSLARMRQVSFETLMPPIRRHLRAVCSAYERDAAIEVYGEQTLVDPTVLGGLQGVLSQLVNNAIVHGIESAPERRRRGKPRAGQLLVVVERDDDELVVTFSDDGRGFDIERIRAAPGADLDPDRTELGVETSRSRRRARAAAAAEDAMEKAVNAAMRDGVSTLTGVVEHAGRGHGLGAVRQVIDELGGHLEVQSVVGQGSRFRMRVPVQQRFEELLLVEEEGMTVAFPTRALAPGATETPLALRGSGQRRVDRVLGGVEGLVSPPPFPFNLLPQVNGTTVGPDGTILFVLDPAPPPDLPGARS